MVKKSRLPVDWLQEQKKRLRESTSHPANIASKCAECQHLKIMDTTFGGGRYVCFRRDPTHRAFLTYGRPVHQGVPLVQRCKSFEYGQHHSRNGVTTR